MSEKFEKVKVISIDTNNLKECDSEDSYEDDAFFAGNWSATNCGLEIEFEPDGLNMRIHRKDKKHVQVPISIQCNLSCDMEMVTVGDFCILMKLKDYKIIYLKFKSENEKKRFQELIQNITDRRMNSVFSQRTEDSSASQYFQFYGYLSQQQNMMQDFVRTSTYQRAIHGNLSDFQDKIVLDVGAGSGILSFFAVQAGAHKVYAVEASNMAQYAQQLVKANNLNEKIHVIAGKIEEISLPEKVDIIISEPMGYMLYNERMLETYLHAKKWLKPGGKMFPSRGDLHVAPFSDEALFIEQFNKSNFWYQTSFHGVDLSSIRSAAMREYFRQPIVDTFDIRICMAKSVRHVVNFLDAEENELHEINIPLEFHVLDTGTCHGLAFWFDVEFAGSTNHVWLSTSPTEPLTHWYQVRCLLQTPLCVKQGQLLTGSVQLIANKRQSYDVTIELSIEGTNITSNNVLDLKNPYFRYTGMQVSAPPGSSTTSPSESYWTHLDAQGARNAVNLVNGISVNGLGEVSMETPSLNSNFINLGQPSIHPGCISSTGRSRTISTNAVNGGNVVVVQHANASNYSSLNSGNFLATSTQSAAQQQLIGGAISPSMFVSSGTLQVHPNDGHSSTIPHSNDHLQTISPTNNHQINILNDLLSPQQAHRSNTTQIFNIQAENATVVDAPMLSAMEQMFSVIQQP